MFVYLEPRAHLPFPISRRRQLIIRRVNDMRVHIQYAVLRECHIAHFQVLVDAIRVELQQCRHFRVSPERRRKIHLTSSHGDVIHQVHARVEIALPVHGVLFVEPQERSPSQPHFQIERSTHHGYVYIVLHIPCQLVRGGNIAICTRAKRRRIVQRTRQVVHLPFSEILVVFPLHSHSGFVFYRPSAEDKIRFRAHKHIERLAVHEIRRHILIRQQRHILRPFLERREHRLNGCRELNELRLPYSVERITEVRRQRKSPPLLIFIIDIQRIAP